MFSTRSISISSVFLLLCVAVHAISVKHNYSTVTLQNHNQRGQHGLLLDSEMQPVNQHQLYSNIPAVFSRQTQQQILRNDSPFSAYEQMVAQEMETTWDPMQTSRAFNQQHQPTWSGKPIVIVDYVDDVYYVAAHDDNENEQQPMPVAAEAAKVQSPTPATLHSRAPQTFYDASVHHHNHQQLPQQAFHTNIDSSAYRLPSFSQNWLSSQSPSSSPPAAQTRASAFYMDQYEALKTKEWQQQQQKWSRSAGRWAAPSSLNRAKLQRLAAFAPFFERYVKKYPHRLQAKY